MSRFISAFLALAFALGLAGCNTIQGAGKDVSKAGETIEEAAKKAK